jgi:hypothetical protein
MRHMIVGLGLLALGATGCATATELEMKARVHDNKATAAASIRDYDTAAKEHKKAEKLHAKAVKEAVDEGTTNAVIVPVPAPNP